MLTSAGPETSGAFCAFFFFNTKRGESNKNVTVARKNVQIRKYRHEYLKKNKKNKLTRYLIIFISCFQDFFIFIFFPHI